MKYSGILETIRNVAKQIKKLINGYEERRNLQPNKYFESIINSPLGSGEGSNHDYTERKAAGEKTPPP